MGRETGGASGLCPVVLGLKHDVVIDGWLVSGPLLAVAIDQSGMREQGSSGDQYGCKGEGPMSVRLAHLIQLSQ